MAISSGTLTKVAKRVTGLYLPGGLELELGRDVAEG